MKVGVVSDVHNNVEALTYALEQLRDCDLLLGLGDLVSDYSVDPRIVELSESSRLANILGNHEKSILLHPGSQIRRRLSPELLAFMRDLSPSREFDLDGRKVHVAHGSPWDDPRDHRCVYVREHDSKALERVAASTQAEIVLLGHTHHAMAVRKDQTLVLNPGSCGEGRDSNSRLTFARLDGPSGLATIFLIRPGQKPEPLRYAEF